MGIVLAFAARVLAPAFADLPPLRRPRGAGGFGFVAYCAAALGFGAIRPADIRAALRRSPSAGL